MIIWFIYDISKDKSRRLISEKAMELGLTRVQKSVFTGKISKSTIDELQLYCRSYMNLGTDSIYFLPMCQEDYEKVKLMGQSFDKEFVNKTKKSLFW